ncbi:MAG TPA: PepSY-associated TM helix domain-containing protein, partial [Terriglobales bacterium]|nr:PepSY-associated TM helix domain-containing protein [Terriglobales bacterium]
MRKLIFNLHLYLALFAGPFILVLGLTGGIMAFEPELDGLLHRHRAHVTPAGKPRSLAEINAVIAKAFPGEHIVGYGLGLAEPDRSYQVFLDKSGTAYVNQYTGEILEVLPDQMEFLDYVHQLHLRLLWRGPSRPGDQIMSWAGVAMLLLSLSGLYLWWPAKRTRLTPGATGRRWWFDLHNAAGIFSLIFLAVLSFTGIMIGFEKKTTPLLYRMTGTQPAKQPAIPQAPAGAIPISPDQAIAIAHEALPGAAPFALLIPGPKGAYQVRLRYPEDRTPGGRSRVIVDQYSGKVLFAEGSRTAPAGARL